jgi:hypothetical protein
MPANDDTAELLGGPLPVFGGEIANSDLSDIDAPVQFRRQPRLLPAEQRVAYRLAVLALTLSRVRGAVGSVEHLHLIGWAIRSRRSRSMLLAWWNGRRLADTVTERLDPNLAITLNLALAHGLIRIHGGQSRRVGLTEQGADLAARVDEDEDLLRSEKSFLEILKPLSDARITRVLGKVAS